MKICTKCNKNKPLDEFGKAKYGHMGLRAICKKCHNEINTEWFHNNKNHVSCYGKKYREEKAEQISAQRAIHTALNKEKLAEYARQYRLDNPGKVNAKTAKRRAQKRKATPPWLTEYHWIQIEAYYIEAATKTRDTGIPHEVDHIEPLKGKDRSGLHVPWNLKVITRHENRKKSRKTIS